jgi:pimeloyl-ACP methyl ester carboxylesterase
VKLILLILSVSFLSANSLLAQSVKSSKVKANGISYKYHYLEPSGEKKGIVILLPGSGERFKNILKYVGLAKVLFNNGFVVVVPEVHTLLYADDYSIDLLDALLQTKLKDYGAKPLFLGGFSSGGAISARYAEILSAKKTPINLNGLFIIDPPLDLQRVYAAGIHKLQSCDGIIKREGLNITTMLENTFGGPPDKRTNEYISHSPFTANIPDGGNAKYLFNLPIRLYSEPDLDFVRKTYCDQMEMNDLNSTDLEGLHQYLIKNGNNRCEYITTKGRGFHSWNIIEPNDLLAWILKLF